MLQNKIKTQKEIIKLVQRFKTQGRKIVTISGSFDLLHLGHILSFQEAKLQGDILIVLLNSDRSIKGYKGSQRPIISQEDRAQILSALESVDYLVIFNEINPKRLLGKIKPNIHCQGKDWGKDCVERKVVEKNGGKIYLLKWQKGLSSTKLIKRILAVYSSPAIKAVFLDRDGTINPNEPEYIHRKEDFKFKPGAIAALQKLSKTDYKIIILTNQSGIGRGYFTEKDLRKLHQWMLGQLKKNKVRIDKIYYCPHLPKDNCSCRKPKIRMLMKTVVDFDISLNESWVVGDSRVDIMMGREANVKTIKIGRELSRDLKIQPHYYAKNLLGAVKIILRDEK